MICKEFEREENRCRWYFGNGICRKVRICPDAQKALKISPNTTWSFSRFDTLRSCPQAYFFRYLLRVERIARPLYFLESQLGHELVQERFGGEKVNWDVYKEMREDEIIKLKALVSSLELFSIENPVFEAQIEKEKGGLSFLGFLDIRADTEAVEMKFVSSFDWREKWKTQISFYFWLDPTLERILLALFKKPKTSKANSESLEEFSSRLSKSIQRRPHEFYGEINFERREFDFEEIEREIRVLLDYSKWVEKMIFKNTSACDLCEYIHLCQGGELSPEVYKIRERRD
jgi:hypothetical protein